MALVGFDFKTIFFSLLLFFGGCTALEPPPPITIQTPTVTTTEDNEFVAGTLKIVFETDQKIELLFKDINEKVSYKPLTNPTPLEIAREIKNISLGKNNSAYKNVWIVGNNKSSAKAFQNVIEALKELKVYKYKLITSQE